MSFSFFNMSRPLHSGTSGVDEAGTLHIYGVLSWLAVYVLVRGPTPYCQCHQSKLHGKLMLSGHVALNGCTIFHVHYIPDTFGYIRDMLHVGHQDSPTIIHKGLATVEITSGS